LLFFTLIITITDDAIFVIYFRWQAGRSLRFHIVASRLMIIIFFAAIFAMRR